jgi:YD repeat-containing protein
MSSSHVTYAGLWDINGDGLPDYVQKDPAAPRLLAYFNRGDSFDPTPLALSSKSYLAKMKVETTLPPSPVATRRYELRQLDYDGDGLTDLVRRTGASAYTVHLNRGAGFADVGVVTGGDSHTDDALFAYATDGGVHRMWEIVADVLDLSGDGVDDYVRGAVTRKVPAATVPVLLSRIDNGHGGVVDVSYAPSTRAEVVTRDGLAMPQVVWLTQRVTRRVAGGLDAPTDYAYAQPRYERDLRGRFGFRGFSHVTRTGPGTTVRPVHETTFDYTLDLVGNRSEKKTTKPGPIVETITYTYSANDELLTEAGPTGTTTYTYTLNGETSSKVAPSESVTYSWHFESRLGGAISSVQGTMSFAKRFAEWLRPCCG